MKKRIFSSILILMFIIPLVVISSITTFSSGSDSTAYQVGKYLYATVLFVVSLVMVNELYSSLLKKEIKDNIVIKYTKYCVTLFLSLIPFLIYIFNDDSMSVQLVYIFYVSSFILNMFSAIILKTQGIEDRKIGYIFLLSNIITLLPFSYQIISVSYGWEMFFYIALICISVDSFGLLVGKKFGKHKVAPNISPNKTIEGTIGGILISTTLSTTWFIMFNLDNSFLGINESEIVIGIVYSFMLSLGLSIASFLGDLLFSWVKRKNELKDYSNLIPGHGGILDRLDSHILVNTLMILPIFIIYF